MPPTVTQSTLETRTTPFCDPPESLNLLTASPKKLHKYGIPPRPSPEGESALFREWSMFFNPRPMFVPASFEVSRTSAPQLRQGTGSLVVARSNISRYETSSDWCGAYIKPNGDKTFLQVSGRWTVPTPALPPTPDMGCTYASSAWVGFDGQRRYLDSSLPQTGTWHAVTKKDDRTTCVEWFAWVQWWARCSTSNFPLKIKSVPITGDDEIACMVRVWAPSIAAIYVKNVTTNMLTHFHISAPTVTLQDGSARLLEISGATAEWIMEQPAIPGGDKQYKLPDFDRIEFRSCSAAEADRDAPGWPHLVGARRDLTSPQLVRLYQTKNDPRRITFASMPSLVNSTSVRVRYGGFN